MKKRIKVVLASLVGILGTCSVAQAQSSFTYSFTAANGTPWPMDWSGSTFLAEYHHDYGWGFDAPGSSTDDYTGATMSGTQGYNKVGAKYYNAATYSAATSFTMTMGWTPNGVKGFVDDGSVPSSGLPNQIFQMGVFSGTPSNSWFGLDLLLTAGTDSLFLGGTEVSANKLAQTGVINLGIFDESGTKLADFGNMTYSAHDFSDFANATIYNFSQTYSYSSNKEFMVSLMVDQYVVNQPNNTTSLISHTDLGSQSVFHGLSNVNALVPGLGLAIHDSTVVSITGANYDGGVAIIPEPSASLLALLAAPLAFYRRRKPALSAC